MKTGDNKKTIFTKTIIWIISLALEQTDVFLFYISSVYRNVQSLGFMKKLILSLQYPVHVEGKKNIMHLLKSFLQLY